MQRLANATIIMKSCTILFSTEMGSDTVISIVEDESAEKGSFYTVQESMKRFEAWLKKRQKK